MTARIAIVGSGPAGMAAAISAIDAGADVILIDEAPREGGQIYRQSAQELGLPSIGLLAERLRKKSLLAEFENIRDRLDLRFSTTAHSLYEGPELQVANDQTSERLSVDAVIIAAGVSEKTIPFPGWTLPGVLYAGAAQSFLKGQGVRIGDRIALSGAGALPIAVAAQMANAGGEICALTLTRSPLNILRDPAGVWAGRTILREGSLYLAQLAKKGIFYKARHAVVQAHGDQHLERVTIAKLSPSGMPIANSKYDVDVDLLLLNHGFTANSELVRMAGVQHRYDQIMGGWLPVVDGRGRTSLEGIYVAGDGAGLRGAISAEAEGRIVGAAAAADALNKSVTVASAYVATRIQQERFQTALRRTLVLPEEVASWMDNETIVCRCEGVTAGNIRRAFSEGHKTLDALKRNTRCGMGWCGGRTCLQNAALLAQPTDISGPLDPMRARPVARPVKLGALADQRQVE